MLSGKHLGTNHGMQRMSTTTGSDEGQSQEGMGCGEQETEEGQAISQVDAAYISALNRIADAIILLAHATAGEFEQEDDDFPIARDISGRPI